jgi:riboflavin biosynthesis pyrimidine reductase
VRQLLPEAADPVDPLRVYEDMPAGGERPGVRLVMIAGVDGAIAVEGTSGGLGGPADRRVYLTLRSLADIVLVAAGTVRAEGYGPPSLPAELAEARRARGQAPGPRIAVVSRSLDLDWRSSLFTEADPDVRPIVLTGADAPAARRAAAERVADVITAGSQGVDLAEALGAVGRLGAASVLAEGGPRLNGALAAAGLLDELCLTISPALAGGDAARILNGPPLAPPLSLRLRSLCEEDGFLFARYRAG